jgi:hypothetical protein
LIDRLLLKALGIIPTLLEKQMQLTCRLRFRAFCDYM